MNYQKIIKTFMTINLIKTKYDTNIIVPQFYRRLNRAATVNLYKNKL